MGWAISVKLSCRIATTRSIPFASLGALTHDRRRVWIFLPGAHRIDLSANGPYLNMSFMVTDPGYKLEGFNRNRPQVAIAEAVYDFTAAKGGRSDVTTDVMSRLGAEMIYWPVIRLYYEKISPVYDGLPTTHWRWTRND